MTKTRFSYKSLCSAVDEWNERHGLKYRDKGFLMVKNDGSVHWLAYIWKQGETSEISIGGTDGSLKSCMQRLRYLQPEA